MSIVLCNTILGANTIYLGIIPENATPLCSENPLKSKSCVKRIAISYAFIPYTSSTILVYGIKHRISLVRLLIRKTLPQWRAFSGIMPMFDFTYIIK